MLSQTCWSIHSKRYITWELWLIYGLLFLDCLVSMFTAYVCVFAGLWVHTKVCMISIVCTHICVKSVIPERLQLGNSAVYTALTR